MGAIEPMSWVGAPRHPGAVEPSLMARPGALEPSLMAHRGAGEPVPGEGVVEPASFYSPQVGEGGCLLSRPSSPLSCCVVRRRTPLALDLFCGSNSVGGRLRELGFQVVSVDNRPSTNPTFCVDILTWKYWEVFSPGDFEVIGASPPCTEYSRAKTIGTRDLEGADLLVQKALEIISFFKPKFWWVENPRSGLLKEREVVKGIPFVDVDYCQFCDWGYKKPTRFWACKLISDLPPVLCNPRICPNVHRKWDGKRKHFRLLGGANQGFTPASKARIPPHVIDYLLGKGVCEKPRNRRANVWKQVSPPPNHTGSIPIDQRFFHEIPSYQLNKVRKVGEHLQLLMKVSVLFSNGTRKIMSVLVDTGAEANLVRKGFLDDFFLRNAREPLSFVTANGQPLEGGKRTAKFTMFFDQVVDGRTLPQTRSFEAEFYEAVISVDAILSFPWMADHKIGVFPHHQALALEEPVFTLLFGLRNEGSRERQGGRRKHRGVRRRWVQKNALEVDQISEEDLEKYLLFVGKMNLELPCEGLEEPTKLTDEEIDIVVQNLLKVPEARNCFYIEARENDGVEDPRVEEFRRKIHERFDGVVLCHEFKPDPPVRGMYG